MNAISLLLQKIFAKTRLKRCIIVLYTIVVSEILYSNKNECEITRIVIINCNKPRIATIRFYDEYAQQIRLIALQDAYKIRNYAIHSFASAKLFYIQSRLIICSITSISLQMICYIFAIVSVYVFLMQIISLNLTITIVHSQHSSVELIVSDMENCIIISCLFVILNKFEIVSNTFTHMISYIIVA